MTKKNIMREFFMGEISGVDVPAQAPALKAIMKRHDQPSQSDFEKKAALTSANEGHQHL